MHSPDAPRARRGPGPPARGLGSTPGSPPWTASGVDSLPCSLDDTHSPSSSADGERCVGRIGIIARNCDTCAVFECSSAASFQPPMMARPCTITPSNRTRRRTRSRTEEDGLQNPLEENVIEENRTFTPADLLLFQNGDGTDVGDRLNCHVHALEAPLIEALYPVLVARWRRPRRWSTGAPGTWAMVAFGVRIAAASPVRRPARLRTKARRSASARPALHSHESEN